VSITASDLATMLSTTAGTGGSQTIQANPNLSLGGYLSLTTWTGGSLSDLFNPVSGAANSSLTPSYRCIFLVNNHATLTWSGVVMWISSNAVGAPLAIGVDPTAASALNASSTQAVQIANDTTAPVGVTFSAPTTQGSGLLVGDIGPKQCKAIWYQRTPVGGGALATDTAVVQFTGNSP